MLQRDLLRRAGHLSQGSLRRTSCSVTSCGAHSSGESLTCQRYHQLPGKDGKANSDAFLGHALSSRNFSRRCCSLPRRTLQRHIQNSLRDSQELLSIASASELIGARQATCIVRARRSCAAEALRVLSARSCCAGANVGTTVAAPSGVGSRSVCVPFFDTRMQRSTCNDVIEDKHADEWLPQGVSLGMCSMEIPVHSSLQARSEAESMAARLKRDFAAVPRAGVSNLTDFLLICPASAYLP